jgi:hypothetical protein
VIFLPDDLHYQLVHLREEQHLMLPTVTSIKLTQQLYDVLFQYLITDEQEVLLKKFIDMLEGHIKRKDRSPFSVPIADLSFLDEGLQELRMLNWMEIPVTVFQLTLDEDPNSPAYTDLLERCLDQLERIMVFSHRTESDLIWSYPYQLVR